MDVAKLGGAALEKGFRLVARFADVCDFSTLQAILYYECSRQFNIYN